MNSLFEQPVLLIVFLRAENLSKQLKMLAKSNRTIYISIDGPRNQEDKLAQENVFKVIRSFILENQNQVKILARDTNVGIACSVIAALDWFFSEQEQGIVVEDDLEFDEDFLAFMDYCLLKFHQNSRVMMISGNNYQSCDEREPKSLMTNFPQTWGWATWAFKWKILRKTLRKAKFPSVGSLCDPNYWFFWIGRIRTLSRRIDTWDIPIAYEMYTSGGLCVLPPFNLCRNVGSDSFATHTTIDQFPIGFPRKKLQGTLIDIVSDKNSSEQIQAINRFIASRVFGVTFMNIVKSPIYLLEGLMLWLVRNLNYRNHNLTTSLELAKTEDFEIMNGRQFVEKTGFDRL